MVEGATILGITNVCLGLIGALIFSFILNIGIKFRRDRGDISLMLTCNTCLAALLTCLTSCVMTSSSLSNGFMTFNFDFCRIWGLCYDIAHCSIYHSYYLQAFYRLCRVVFHKKRSLQSYTLYLILIGCQWTLAVTILLPPICLHWYVKIPNESFCLVPYTNLGAEMYHIVILYAIPLTCIVTIYVWITMFIRDSTRLTGKTLSSNQRRRNLRDLIVIRRIIMMVSALIALRFPTVVFMIYAVIVGHLYRLTFGIVGLITTFCLILIGLITIHITPKLRNHVTQVLNLTDNQIHAGEVPQRHSKGGTTSGGQTTPVPPLKHTTTIGALAAAQKYSAIQEISTTL